MTFGKRAEFLNVASRLMDGDVIPGLSLITQELAPRHFLHMLTIFCAKHKFDEVLLFSPAKSPSK